MENIEKGCHWYFPILAKGIEEKNTTDSDEETLKNQSSIEALVRESIQNSLDVHDGSMEPVIMTFKFGSIKNPNVQIPNFLEIKKYIQGSKDYILSTGNNDANLVFDPMIKFMESHNETFPYLCVSDSNTTGMDKARFKAFTSKGSSFKPQIKGAGGSYGIGKAAYYMASKIRTIIVSSMYKDEKGEIKSVFEGFAKLTTNKIGNTKYYDKGYYDIAETVPVDVECNIPKGFERTSCGTSVFIMGLDDDSESKEKLFKEIIKAVIRNFWLAIHESKLEVNVDFEGDAFLKKVIDSKELANLISGYAPFDNTGDYINPRPYYEAVTSAVKYDEEETHTSVYFDNNHEKYGKARLYLIKNDQKHDRYLRMRSPRMFVSLQKTNGKRGYNGVLVCDDRWNELLTHSEPPAHDAWVKGRIQEKKTIDQNTKNEALDALYKINKWVDECISKFLNEDSGEEVDFFGIKDLLYTDKNLDSSSRQNGNAASNDDGTPTYNEGDYGIMTTKSLGVEGDNQIHAPRPIASVTEVKRTKAEKNENGKLRGKRKKHRKQRKVIDDIIHKPGTTFPLSEVKNGKDGHYREITSVDVHCFIPSGQEDKYLYTMVIKSPKKIEKAMVELSTGGALASVEIPVAFSDKGKADNNRICDLSLEEGLNTLHFKFNDKISHSIKVATYEFK